MTDHLRWAVALFMGCLGIFASVTACATPVHVTQALWFHEPAEGYSRAPFAREQTASLDKWQTVTLPHALPRRILTPEDQQASKIPTSITWYRVQIPSDHSWAEGARYLYIPRWKMDGQISIYANQHLLYQSDSLIHWNAFNTPFQIALDNNTPEHPLSEILIRIVHPRESGGGISSLWLGTHDELHWRYRIRTLLQSDIPYASSAAFLAIGFFGLFIWLKLRNDKGYLLYFGISAAAFIRTLHYHVGSTRLPVSEEWFTWLTLNSLFWLLWIVNAFLNYLHERPSHRLNLSISDIVVLMGVMTWPWNSAWINAYLLSPLFYLLLLITGLCVSFYGLKQSITAKSSGGKLLACWGVLGMIFGVFDLLLQNNWINIENIYLGSYTNILAFMILMRIIFQGYMAKHDEVIAINASLQERLQVREKELEESHKRLRAIELHRQLEQERQRLMQDMHDGMGSNLRTALLAVEKGNLSPSALADVLKDCIDDLKLTIDSMEPMESDLLLLLATFRYRVGSRLESAGIALRWNITDIPKVNGLTPQTSLHILRIFQEAFTNIIKHAGATEITVATQATEQVVTITIHDNGHGFQATHPPVGNGRGLTNQKRRAENIGATIAWRSESSGTEVTLSLPIGRTDASQFIVTQPPVTNHMAS